MASSEKLTDSNWLVLIPTQFELELAQQQLPPTLSASLEICGFGPIVPAARTIQLIQRYRPKRVLLCGIAGGYLKRVEVSQAVIFDHVACYGVGVGSGDTYQSAQTMGWQHWLGEGQSNSIGDSIPLVDPYPAPDAGLSSESPSLDRTLITTMAVSENEVDVAHRLAQFPTAVAEDMEGFAVAAACQLAEIPLTIVRGISNRAGDRDKSNWKIGAAISSAVEKMQAIIESDS